MSDVTALHSAGWLAAWSARAVRVLVLLAVTFLLLVPPASAATGGGLDSQQAASLCGNGGVTSARADSLLPVSRWLDATTSFHSRNNGGGLLGTGLEGNLSIWQRDIGGGLFIGAGNTMWGATTFLTSTAVNACPLTEMGGWVDRAVGQIGASFMDPRGGGAVLALIVVGTVLTTIVRAARRSRSGPWRALAGKLLALAALAVMVTGATGTQVDEGGQVIAFGRFSPGWVVSETSRLISTVASTPAAMVATTSTTIGGSPEAGASGDLMSCDMYHDALLSHYQQVYTSLNGGSIGTAAAMPLVMNSLWETTGLNAWRTTQFGVNNPYGDLVYCRLLDANAGIPAGLAAAPTDDALRPGAGGPSAGAPAVVPAGQRTLMATYWASAAQVQLLASSSPSSSAWGSGDAVRQDRSLIAWAMCVPNDTSTGWQLREGAQGLVAASGKEDKVGEDCAAWWTGGADADLSTAEFNWGRSRDDTIAELNGREYDTSAELDFILSLQGGKGGGSTPIAIGYAVSSLAILGTFGLLAAIVFIAKVMLVLNMLWLFVLGIAVLLPNVDAGEQAAKFARRTLGLIVISAGSMALFALFGLVVRLVTTLLTSASASTPMASMIGASVAPVVALVAMSYGFKKIGMPNPLSVKGALAWGTGAAAVGGGVGAFAGSRIAQRTGRAVTAPIGKAVRDAGSTVVSGAMHHVTGGKFGSPHRTPRGAPPDAAPGAGAAGLPDGAAAPPSTDASQERVPPGGAPPGSTAEQAQSPEGTQTPGGGTDRSPREPVSPGEPVFDAEQVEGARTVEQLPEGGEATERHARDEAGVEWLEQEPAVAAPADPTMVEEVEQAAAPTSWEELDARDRREAERLARRRDLLGKNDSTLRSAIYRRRQGLERSAGWDRLGQGAGRLGGAHTGAMVALVGDTRAGRLVSDVAGGTAAHLVDRGRAAQTHLDTHGVASSAWTITKKAGKGTVKVAAVGMGLLIPPVGVAGLAVYGAAKGAQALRGRGERVQAREKLRSDGFEALMASRGGVTPPARTEGSA